MIERVIRASVENRVLVLFGALLLAIAGIVAVLKTPVDALPDLSDVQVIIKTDYSGQAPEIVENEVTYPISTTMLSVPGASTVRGFSLFGTSFVYVLFEDGTDLYWARSRVLESLNSARTPPVWAGSISTLWWTNPERTIWKACGRSRTGFSSMN